MIDIVAQYGIQFVAITAGAMALSEWATMPIGTPGSTRKRYCCLIYATVLGGLGIVGGLVQAPTEAWYEQAAFVLVMSVVATGAGHAAHSLKGSKKLG